MDNVVKAAYQKLYKNNFPNKGSIENPSIFLDTADEGVGICPQPGKDLVRLYIQVENKKVAEIRYLCGMCDPTALVALETLCNLAKGISLRQLELLSIDHFTKAISGYSEDLVRHAENILILLRRRIEEYEREAPDDPLHRR